MPDKTSNGVNVVAQSSEENSVKKSGCLSRTNIIFILVLGTVLAAIYGPSFYRARAGGLLSHCKSELKNIGTAMEMYSTDWSGKYPTSLGQLTPKYLKTIPECPWAGEVTYTLQTGLNVAYNSRGFRDYYFVQCEGENHTAVSVPPNYPQYDGIQGLIER